jgi:hypothetical protein
LTSGEKRADGISTEFSLIEAFEDTFKDPLENLEFNKSSDFYKNSDVCSVIIVE